MGNLTPFDRLVIEIAHADREHAFHRKIYGRIVAHVDKYIRYQATKKGPFVYNVQIYNDDTFRVHDCQMLALSGKHAERRARNLHIKRTSQRLFKENERLLREKYGNKKA